MATPSQPAAQPDLIRNVLSRVADDALAEVRAHPQYVDGIKSVAQIVISILLGRAADV